MAKLVVQGASLSCSMGNAPSQLSVLPIHAVEGDSASAANIQDTQPIVNIAPFGMCMSMANPQVAAATAAAMGALTPQPCMPMTTAPWTPGSTSVTIAGQQDGLVGIAGGLREGETVVSDGSLFLQFANSIK